MSAKIPAYDRGKIAGHYPALSNRQDEAYVDFIRDARNLLHHAQQKPITEYSIAILESENLPVDASPDTVKTATDRLMQDNALRNYYRVKRTYQESFWDRIETSFNRRRDDLLSDLAKAEETGPGSVEIDSDLKIPEYASSEIHLQPGGNMNEDLAGYIYDHGMMVFLGGIGNNDQAHKMFAFGAAEPEDGNIKRILDIGCGAGAMTMALKEKYPDAEVIGIDMSAPMVRYAHKRSLENGLDITFKQMPAEALDFEDGSFDLIVANLLFHELPVSVSKQVTREVHRLLRNGGVFHLFDFPGDKNKNAYAMFFVEMDGADNGEPFLPGFIRSNFEDIMLELGFEMHKNFDPNMIFFKGRPAVKKAA